MHPMCIETEPHGPPTPLEILATDRNLHRSVMSFFMQGGSRPYGSPPQVADYLRRRPDMAEHVQAWRQAGATELARRRQDQEAARLEKWLIEREHEERKRQAERRKLALSHITGLTWQEHFNQQLATRLLAASALEPEQTKRAELLGEAWELLVG